MEFMQRKPSRLVWGLIACVLLAVAGYGLYWNMLADQVRDGIEGWAEARRAEGYKVEYRPVEVGGFPFWLRAVITDPVLSKSVEKRSWNWRGPGLSISARPWRVTLIEARGPGRHLVTLTTPEGTRTLDINAGGLNVSLRWAALSALPLEVRAEMKEITYRSAPVAGLGRKTQTLNLHAEVTGPPPGSLDAAAMAHWRDGGGTVEIRSLNMRHGSLDVDGDGTIALDENLQPLAAFSLDVRGFMEAVDGLKAAGVIKPRGADIMKTVLAVLAGGKGDAKGKQLKIPLSIQDEIIYLGPVVVGRVPYLNWPTGS